jgi:hypothetical protein
MSSMNGYKVKDALQDPLKVFDHPNSVVACDELSMEDKLKVLQQWELDARGLQVAEEENMGGGEPDLLGRVHDALRLLKDEVEVPKMPQSDTKLG